MREPGPGASSRVCLAILAILTGFATMAATVAAAQSASAGHGAAGIARGKSLFEARLSGGERVEVFAYRAANHGPDDPIVIVLAGGGRNGDDYRDSWISAADRFNLLVLAPSFDERQFPGPINYNLAGMIGEGADVETLRNVTLKPPQTWLYSDIEAIFDQAVARTGSAQTRYDLFGHSAGAQVVHRMVLFAPETRIRTAVAANAGWYTTPTTKAQFPYGIGGIGLPPGQLEKAYGRRLLLLLGELDNAQESRGHLRDSVEANAQGEHRLARGKHFHLLAMDEGARLGLCPEWRLKVVPGVGHDYRKMAEAAAEQLNAARGPDSSAAGRCRR